MFSLRILWTLVKANLGYFWFWWTKYYEIQIEEWNEGKNKPGTRCKSFLCILHDIWCVRGLAFSVISTDSRELSRFKQNWKESQWSIYKSWSRTQDSLSKLSLQLDIISNYSSFKLTHIAHIYIYSVKLLQTFSIINVRNEQSQGPPGASFTLLLLSSNVCLTIHIN